MFLTDKAVTRSVKITAGFHPGGGGHGGVSNPPTQNIWGGGLFFFVDTPVKSKLNHELVLRVVLIVGSVTPY